MILYEKGTTDFTKNGFGYLNNVLNAKVTEKLNGEYSLTFDYPLNEVLSNELKEERIVKCKVADGTNQCFIIKNVTKTYEKMTITCVHLFYLLLTDLAENIYPYNLSPKPFLDWVLARANYELPFTTTSDVSVQKTARYVRKNLVEVIIGEQKNSMANLFGIEIKRNNWNIGLNARIGADRGEKLLYGKNITGIDLNVDTNDLYTRIMPIGFDGLMLPEKYIDADNIDDYPYPKIGIFEFEDIRYDPEDETAYQDIDDAYDALRAAVQALYDNNHVNEPKINIKVDWLELSKTEEYKQYSNLERVELGDTIHAEIFGLNYITRVIKTVYNPLNDTIEQFEIGTVQPDYATQMNKYEIELQKINPASILEEAQDKATNLITQAMGGYVYKTNNELYIMDTDDPNTAVHVWRWNINGLGYSSTGINGTYGLAMTMDGAIVADFITTGTLTTSVIQGYDSLTTQVSNNTGQISTLTQSVGELNSKIQDIADITTSAESEYAEVQLLNVNESQPIQMKIHPTGTNISYLYPRNNLYPSDTLYMPDRVIKFTNTSTNEVFYYTLFDDLLYYDSTHYDEFYFDYDNNVVQITKKCEYDANGDVVLKQSEVVETTTFPTESQLYLSTGNYTITLPGYTNAYLMVRCMASNIYTAQFSTKSELSQTASQIRTEVAGTYATKNELATTNSTITQTADSITAQVAQTYQTKSDAQNDYTELNSTITQTANAISSTVAQKVGKTEVISSINQSAEEITISANKVNISGVITAINNDTSTTIDGDKITTGSITANQVSSAIITTSNFSSQNINANKITTGTLNGNNVSITNIKAGNIVSGTLNGNNVSITNLKAGNIVSGTLNGIPITNGTYTFSKGSQKLVISTIFSYGIFTLWSGSTIRAVIDSGTFYAYNSSGSLGAYLNSSGVHTSSDIRYKKHIKNIEQQKSIDIITNLTPIEYDYNTEKKHRGLSAQEVEKALNENGYKNQVYKIEEDGKYTLNYIELIPDLINCIKYQQKEIEELKQEIKKLKEDK